MSDTPAGVDPDDSESPVIVSRAQAASDLLPLVYQQLRQLAQVRLSQERPDHTLQATALVNEAYVRLAGDGSGPAKFANQAHFYTAAAEAMRRILVEHARARASLKRGGGRRKLNISSVLDLAEIPDSDDVLALDEALSRLEGETPEAAAVVRLRFFAGLSVVETATTLGVAARTVDRDWAYARAWLYQQLQ
jgi:RNA polymerase sigma factor (TIGR02999 family)